MADNFKEHYGKDNVEHLSTALTSADREKTLKRVSERLKDPNDINWALIATSCVEAGVELSFRIGFRELCSVVSLLQTAGRVNRKGLYSDAEMWTFCLAPDYLLKENPGIKDSSEILRRYIENGTEISPVLSTQSIADEIRLSGVTTKYKDLLIYENNSNFPSVENGFKVIDSDTKIVVVNEEIASKIEHGKLDWRELQTNSVRIPFYKLRELETKEILPGIYKWNLDYNGFLGYMAGIIKLEKLLNNVLIG